MHTRDKQSASMAMATAGRFSSWLRLVRTVRFSQALQTSYTLQARGTTVRMKIPGVRWYGDSAAKYNHDYFESLVKDKPLVIFIKGEPSAPMCGFSNLVVQILQMHGADKYESYDVLEDVDFKEGMKEYSNWPTFPQVYMNGELVGGADILLQMHKSGELISEFEHIGHRSLLAGEDSSDDKSSS